MFCLYVIYCLTFSLSFGFYLPGLAPVNYCKKNEVENVKKNCKVILHFEFNIHLSCNTLTMILIQINILCFSPKYLYL